MNYLLVRIYFMVFSLLYLLSFGLFALYLLPTSLISCMVIMVALVPLEF